MSVVKEFTDEKAKIRIHNDYIDKKGKEAKEMLICLVIDYVRSKNI